MEEELEVKEVEDRSYVLAFAWRGAFFPILPLYPSSPLLPFSFFYRHAIVPPLLNLVL